ncbi:hypothetical protein GGX14DRAFT_323509, partial [Mycena pura]
IENYSRKPAEVYRRLRTRPGCPQFTETGWKALIQGEYVDFDSVSQALFGYRITNSDRWHQLWSLFASCGRFAFNKRGPEFDTYAEFIKGLFISTDLPHNVIACDKAIRTYLGTTTEYLFDDLHMFQRFQQAYLIPGGIHY